MASAINTEKTKRIILSLRGQSRKWWHFWRVQVRKPQRRFVSPLLLRILAVNFIALAILVGSVLYLGRYQDRLIASQIESLRLQARLSASAIGEGAVVVDDEERNILSPLLSRLMIRRLVEASDTRTRLFDPEFSLLADSRLLQGRAGKVQVEELMPPDTHPFWFWGWLMGAFDFIDRMIEQQSYPSYQEESARNGESFEIAHKAMTGETAYQVWSLPRGGLMLAVAVPVQRYKQVLGTLMVSRPDTTIDAAVREVRSDILKIFVFTLFITVLLSVYLSRAIARPIRLLAQAADGLRHGQKQIVGLAGTANLLSNDTIPDFSSRHDEIGDLSSALRDLTAALAQRIGAIENFAADVAHEIKNPLTSLRSAVETAERVHDGDRQRRLMAIIRDDVDRLDRLISDISNASRLDAELGRDEATLIDVGQMLTTLVDFYSTPSDGGIFDAAKVVCMPFENNMFIMGVEVRLVQVMQNLISNALSFAPPQTEVILTAKNTSDGVVITVEDKGPGIPENKLSAIFDRFYSERPKAEKFGTHSGLGLSISKQIIEAHQGHLFAENRKDETGKLVGACFIVQLPSLS